MDGGNNDADESGGADRLYRDALAGGNLPDAIELIKDAKIITESGVFSIVLEMISSPASAKNIAASSQGLPVTAPV